MAHGRRFAALWGGVASKKANTYIGSNPGADTWYHFDVVRWLLVVGLIVAPTIAAAKPSVAVVPLDGDTSNKVGNAVAKAAEDESSSVTGPKETGKAMEKLDISAPLSKKDQKKLRGKLDVEVLIAGKVEDEGDEKSVELTVAGKGIKSSKLKLRFKKASSPKFNRDLADALAKRLSPGEPEEDEEDEKPRKRSDDDDEDKPKKKKKKKKRRSEDDEEARPRHAVTQVAIRLNAGAGFGRRGLTYEATGTNPPPRVGTIAPSARVDVEAYPGAMSTLKGAAAGIGIYGHYDRTIGLSIDVPMSGGQSAPISASHYEAGVRYRVVFGGNSFAFGVGYAGRKYTADRSGLGMGVKLDMPDVSYRAIVPNVVGRFAATPTVGVFVGGSYLLLLDAGPIVTNANFGYAKTLAFEAAGGVDVALGKGYGLRVAAELSQVGFDFRSTVRGVSAATDRTIGAVATFEVLY